ncbi:DUF29 domain-containing protein [Synechocystis salina]|uniref:DUF29 domain-containing protein n=1 Tax=Synechocystis salina LEGE 00031 TaxID=1828736 RepID=A0ABR9VQL5_9SYNC|nr:DUF29 domain-containing protein [Synechocystis salina]MBE9240406.1 DUF29 domain-containing protein [Synechocystis salina LEGE 00041]MBE9253639.1 DUF29 domain-containing protein [Synechocystis salina LEGE 00031]
MSLTAVAKSLYEEDYLLWLETTLDQLKLRQVEQIDWDNLVEEIEGLGIQLRHKVDSYLRQLLIHLLLYRYWTTERENSGRGWRGEIGNFRDELENLLESKTLYNFFLTRIDLMYLKARRRAIDKTGLAAQIFPENCPFSVAELLDPDFYPDAATTD